MEKLPVYLAETENQCSVFQKQLYFILSILRTTKVKSEAESQAELQTGLLQSSLPHFESQKTPSGPIRSHLCPVPHLKETDTDTQKILKKMEVAL